MFPDAFPKSEISDNQFYHCENQFRQFEHKKTLPLWKWSNENRRLQRLSFHFTLLFVVPVVPGSIPERMMTQLFEVLKTVDGSPS